MVFEFISSLLSSAQSYSILLIERAVTALLKLCLLICDEVCLSIPHDPRCPVSADNTIL